MAIDLYQAFPILFVRDLDEAVEFYTQKLGFELAWTWGSPPVRAGVRLGRAEFHLVCDASLPPCGPSVVYCHMHGVEEHHDACRQRGTEIATALGDRPWGVRDFRVIDPSGNRVGFAEITASRG